MRSTRDTFQFGLECVARGFQTLFIMREEGVMLIKTSGIDPLIKLDSLWQSKLPRTYKIMFFKATVESVYLYGAESWTLTKTLERRLDGCYTRLLRHALNISWQQKVRNVVLYKDLPAISTVIKERRLRFAGHCHRATTEPIHSVLFWQPAHGKKRRWSAQNIC